MVKNLLHLIFNTSSEKLHDNQIMVSFDVEWLFITDPVKETAQVLLIKLESDHETQPFWPHDADTFTNGLHLGFPFKISVT